MPFGSLEINAANDFPYSEKQTIGTNPYKISVENFFAELVSFFKHRISKNQIWLF